MTTVIYHSIFVQYLSEADRARLARIIEAAGGRAAGDAPLAWLRMEPGANQADVTLTMWPGGKERLIAEAGYHGRPVSWLGA